MSENTVRPSLTRKRARRVVENDEYTAFARRILAGLARRIAAGDVEALGSLRSLTDEVDACTRTAIRGLREFGYSWSEIASRLGISRQSAHQRWGDPGGSGGLDRRLVEAGAAVSLATLVEVFADHHPGRPHASACPWCGYGYERRDDVCPTLAVVWPLLYQRRHEDQKVVGRLTSTQHADLVNPKAVHAISAAARRSAQRTRARSRPEPETASLLDLVEGAGA